MVPCQATPVMLLSCYCKTCRSSQLQSHSSSVQVRRGCWEYNSKAQPHPRISQGFLRLKNHQLRPRRHLHPLLQKHHVRWSQHCQQGRQARLLLLLSRKLLRLLTRCLWAARFMSSAERLLQKQKLCAGMDHSPL